MQYLKKIMLQRNEEWKGGGTSNVKAADLLGVVVASIACAHLWKNKMYANLIHNLLISDIS